MIKSDDTEGRPAISGDETAGRPSRAGGEPGTGGATADQPGDDETGGEENLADAFRSVGRRLRETSQETRSATEVVDALESRGLVERRPDPRDRRATLAELTGPGTDVLRAIRAARGTEAERFFGRLSPGDRAHLARILRELQA